MNSFRNSRSVLSRLGRLLLRRYKPALPPLPVPRYIHTAARGSPPGVSSSIRGLFSHHLKRVAAQITPAQSPLAASSPSGLPIHLARRWYRNPRKVAAAVLLPFAAGFVVLGALSHHETVPYTNRAHRVILSPSSERELGDVILDNMKKELGDKVLGLSDPETVRVRLIAADIIRGVHRFLPTKNPYCDGGVSSTSDNDTISSSVADDMWVNERQKQGKAAAVQPQIMTGHLGDLSWEVIVTKDDHVRACSIPGGKILVSTGLLKHFNTDAEIATVLAHEVGHVVARHFTEFTKTAMLVPFLYDLLPFSRKTEIEADLIGLMLLAAAGFDPREAAGVYEKLGNIAGDSPWDDYIGSHPSCKKRSRLLSRGKAIEEALELYYKQVCAGEAADRHFPYGGRIWETLT